MSEPAGYAPAEALRQAITDRLRRYAAATPGTHLSDLQRQFAYDRLLVRLFIADPDGWVLKGGTAMLARLSSRARHTIDVDLYHLGGDIGEAERALQQASALDVHDHFRFALNPGEDILQEGRAKRVPVTAFVGVTRFAAFHIDLVVGLAMTGTPDEAPPLVSIDVPGLIRAPYKVYPVADHVADKLCAIIETHPTPSGLELGSTRYKDLADLAVIAHTMTVTATALGEALGSEAARRSLVLPETVPDPIGPGWARGYAAVARTIERFAERDLASALATARAFLDPVLQGAAIGVWNPTTQDWRPPAPY